MPSNSARIVLHGTRIQAVSTGLGPVEVVPQPCHKHRLRPVVSGRQESSRLRHEISTDVLLSWSDGHTSWSVRGAGDRDRTGMASLEGYDSLHVFVLVRRR